MYRALYDFSAQQKGCLSFKSGDIFTVVGDSSGDWIKVENGFGHIGLVPYNYVARVVAQGNVSLSQNKRSMSLSDHFIMHNRQLLSLTAMKIVCG